MANIIEKKENNQLVTEFEIESKLNILVEGQTNNSKQLKAIRDDLQKGFIGLALRNQELLELNKELNQRLEIVVEELNQIKSNKNAKKKKFESKLVRTANGYPSVTQ